MPRICDVMALDQMIAKQIALWEARRRRARENHRPGSAVVDRVTYGPYLLVSREVGSGGREIAREVGARLGWPVFDRQIVEEIARRTQVRRSLVESVDERVRPFLDQIVRSLVDGGELGELEYKRHLLQILLSLGHQGEVIIVGRGAHHVLPRPGGLSVRIIAPLEVRAQRIADLQRITLAEARAAVVGGDRERNTFMRRTFGRDLGAPLDHDLVVNTAALTSEAAAEIVVTALIRKLGLATIKGQPGALVQSARSQPGSAQRVPATVGVA